MTSLNLNYKKLLLGMLTIALVSCSSPWDDRENNGDNNLGVPLNEAILNTAEVSQFGQLLVQTGYDKVLAASKTYTVFAPTNEAMANVGVDILNDAEALNKFVANHIALTSFSSVREEDEERIQMLGNKYLTFKGRTIIGNATIVSADHYASNGVFHIVNKALSPKLNIWEYVNANKNSSEMSDYLLSLTEFNLYKNDSIAKADAIPGVYADSLTNSYLYNVYNLNNEKNSYTLFLMENEGYNGEVDKMKQYVNKTSNDASIDSTAIYSKYFTLRDMAFPKAYTKDALPTKLTSRFGVQFDVDKTQIVGEPIELSNGIIYIMKKVEVTAANRLLTTRIQGEENSGHFNGERNKISYRDKIDPYNVLYNDIVVLNPGSSQFVLTYKAKDMYSVTYKVYWRAINDQLTIDISQKLMIGGKIELVDGVNKFNGAIKDFGYQNVMVNDFTPFYLGEFTNPEAGDIDLITLWAGTATTSPLTLDYLEFVPVVN